jgi:hypothetical protein
MAWRNLESYKAYEKVLYEGKQIHRSITHSQVWIENIKWKLLETNNS